MKIAFVGSRIFSDIKLIYDKIIYWFANNIENHDFISGGATGVDTIAEKEFDRWNNYSKYGKLKKFIFKANWEKYGKSAGARRNQEIVNKADYIVAFWDGKSKGTKITIDMAIKAGKPVDIYIRK